MSTLPGTIHLSDAALRLRLPYRKAYDCALSGALDARRSGRNLVVTIASVERLEKALAAGEE